ncbi:MAG: carboxymuconolactone decarboxylase family protein [Rhodospirillaceae bacterium]|jgi:alkylhydroperoxidase family enzyme|nr:carboxymuconolactone decarboxylase family protein [Rhodospirillaceae bacterium]MBT5458679.1 carboxymuconolactone decarboxylase family protein [Rhodospirillaceae bacterium]
MTRVSPLRREDHPDLDEKFFTPYEQTRGYVPNSNLVMARRPKLLAAFRALNAAVFDPDNIVPAGLLALVGNIASQAAGCMYCVAHTANNSGMRGVEAEKVAALWEYETSPLFDEGERAALRFAQGAASVPNMVTDEDAEAVKAHFGEDGVVEILAVVSFYGFLNRWNDSLATELEEIAFDKASKTLAETSWDAGKHTPKTR